MPFISKKILNEKIQASYTEGQKSVNDALLGIIPITTETTYKNNYITYDAQVNELYKMYYCESELGNDTTGTIIDLRTAIICGEGISIIAKKQKTLKFLNKILKDTRLNGDKLISLVAHGELEGKQLISLKPDREKQKFNIKQILYHDYKYKVEYDKDNDEIARIYTMNDGQKKDLPIDNAIFVKLSGEPDEYNRTPPKSAGIIQDIKNHDKAKYDLRQVNHHYGFPTPAVKCPDGQSVKQTNDGMIKSNWRIGSTFVSTGDLYYPTPPNSFETLSREISICVKIISRRTGLPVHWLGWTDLMSNRATAEDLAELIMAGSKVERLIWIDKIKEILIKIMQLSIDYGFDDAVYDEDFEIDLPYISLNQLEKISNVWLPLQMADVISMGQLRNKLPGIDPEKTQKLIDDEKESRIEENNDNAIYQPVNNNQNNQDDNGGNNV